MKVKSLSRVWLLATPWTAAYQAPPSMGFSRQESWSGVPLPSPTGVSSSSAIIKEVIVTELQVYPKHDWNTCFMSFNIINSMEEMYSIFPFAVEKESERFYKLPMVKGLIGDLSQISLNWRRKTNTLVMATSMSGFHVI